MRVDCSITENFIKEINRMITSLSCDDDCDNCCFRSGCGCLMEMQETDVLLAIKTVQKWSDEHQQITNLDYLLKHFPNTKLDEDGTPSEICPDSIGLPLADGMICKGNAVDCKKCWSRLYEEK